MSYNFLMLALPDFGHVYPQLPLAEELVRSGHSVTFISSPRFKEAIENIGSIWVKNESIQSAANFNKINVAERATRFTHIIIEGAQLDLETVHRKLSGQKFDAILYDTFSIAGPILGEKLDIPQFQLWASVATPPTTSGEYLTYPLTERINLEIMDKFLAGYGIINYQPSITLSEQNFAFFPDYFQLGGKDFPDNFHFLGPSIGPRPNDAAWFPSRDFRPLIYISLGTVLNNNSEFFRQCMRALDDGRYQVFISLGERVTIKDLPEVSSNFTISTAFPQTKVLEHTSVFVSHAGMNSCMEGLFYQVPFVLAPQQSEQGYNAQRLVDLGVGQLLTTPYTAEEIRQKIDKVLSNRKYKEQAVYYGHQIRNNNGVKHGVRIIENTVRQRI